MSVEVSVLCTTYNQRDYVADMLEGILAQKTSFDVEVLVHDDASTDGTLDVLHEYEERFGGRLRIFEERVNQHEAYSSRGYFTWLLAPEARGRYVAFCEGDDYWCDPLKLQVQYDYLEGHPACAECVHRARRVEASTGETIDVVGMGEQARDLDAEAVIREWAVPTASRLIRRELLAPYARDWVFDHPAGDFPLAVYLASCGYTHHDPAVMSVYRFRAPGSYSASTLAETGILRNAVRWLAMLDEIDARTNGAYHQALLEGQALGYARLVAARDAGVVARVGLAAEALELLEQEREEAARGVREHEPANDAPEEPLPPTPDERVGQAAAKGLSPAGRIARLLGHVHDRLVRMAGGR